MSKSEKKEKKRSDSYNDGKQFDGDLDDEKMLFGGQKKSLSIRHKKDQGRLKSLLVGGVKEQSKKTKRG